MISYILSWMVWLASFTHLTIKTGQEKNSIAIQGSCYNVATGVDLKTKAFVLSGDKKFY